MASTLRVLVSLGEAVRAASIPYVRLTRSLFSTSSPSEEEGTECCARSSELLVGDRDALAEMTPRTTSLRSKILERFAASSRGGAHLCIVAASPSVLEFLCTGATVAFDRFVPSSPEAKKCACGQARHFRSGLRTEPCDRRPLQRSAKARGSIGEVGPCARAGKTLL
jgi:hypothetical protein